LFRCAKANGCLDDIGVTAGFVGTRNNWEQLVAAHIEREAEAKIFRRQFMKKFLRGTALWVLPICFSLCMTGTGLAQNTNSGDIRGTVTDATGAVLDGVTVTVLDVDKNVTHTYVTNGSGLFDTGSIVRITTR
jgi:hypothetical protein